MIIDTSGPVVGLKHSQVDDLATALGTNEDIFKQETTQPSIHVTLSSNKYGYSLPLKCQSRARL